MSSSTCAQRRAISPRTALWIALVLAAGACSDRTAVDGAFNPYPGYSSERYGAAEMWLCRPDLESDACRASDLAGTAWRADGTTEPIAAPAPVAADADTDCFYVYPTVDLAGAPGNHTDFSDIRPMLDPLLIQAAPFRGLCRVFAPLYRQGTIGSFGSPQAEEIFALAYSDVAEAFRHYMGQFNQGRRIVVIGHSQGTDMTMRLLQNEFDAVPGLRERLVTALLVGGSVTVPAGGRVGGSFQEIPLCASADETGCVIAFRSYAEGYPPTQGSNVVPPGDLDTACTNPGALGGGPAIASAAYFPATLHQPIFDVRDPNVTLPEIDGGLVALRGFYTTECVQDDRGKSYLRVGHVGAAGDVRVDPILYSHPVLGPSFLGTHVLDFSYTLGDLVALVDAKIRAAR